MKNLIYLFFAVSIFVNVCYASVTKSSSGIQESIKNHENFKAIKEVAETGNIEAMCQLGIMYQYGIGTVQNYYSAYKWYKMAAQGGDSRAKANIGFLHLFGLGTFQSDYYAFKYLSEAAKAGEAEAMFFWAICMKMV